MLIHRTLTIAGRKTAFTFAPVAINYCRSMAIMLLVAGSLLTCACSKTPQMTKLSPDATILAFGDSLTFGTGAGESESYPAVLNRLTGKKVVNAGVPGEVSSTGILRLPELLDRDHPALVILCHGGNDLLAHQNHQADSILKCNFCK